MGSFDQRQYVQLKSRLTRAINQGQPGKIIDECIAALAIFQATGYPDDWTRWLRAMHDAILKANRVYADHA
jgi:hypothetical protein